MFKVIVVEDDEKCRRNLLSLLDDYKINNQLDLSVTAYPSGDVFLLNYKANADIIFLDIRMPGINGMEAAKGFRKFDDHALLIFVTDLMQYAIEGYSVNALDYILKPITYPKLDKCMKKALMRLQNNSQSIVIKHNGVLMRVAVSDIEYIEVWRHSLIFHTVSEDIESWGALGDIEKELPSELFARCNRQYLVGLNHIKAIKDSDVTVGNKNVELRISRNLKKDFIAKFTEFVEGRL